MLCHPRRGSGPELNLHLPHAHQGSTCLKHVQWPYTVSAVCFTHLSLFRCLLSVPLKCNQILILIYIHYTAAIIIYFLKIGSSSTENVTLCKKKMHLIIDCTFVVYFKYYITCRYNINEIRTLKCTLRYTYVDVN